jgi:hypothetical protein
MFKSQTIGIATIARHKLNSLNHMVIIENVEQNIVYHLTVQSISNLLNCHTLNQTVMPSCIGHNALSDDNSLQTKVDDLANKSKDNG